MSGARVLLKRSIYALSHLRTARLFSSSLNIPRSGLYMPTSYIAAEWPLQHGSRQQLNTYALSSISHSQELRNDYSMKFSTESLLRRQMITTMSCTHSPSFSLWTSSRSHIRAYSSHGGGKTNLQQNFSLTSANNSPANTGNEWLDNLNKTYHSVADTIVLSGKKAKEVIDATVIPNVQQLYDSHLYLHDVIVPVGGTLFGTILAWLFVPKILRIFYKYGLQSPFALLEGSLTNKQISYDRSVWGAIEDPARYFITFMALSEMCTLLVPSISQYFSQAWRSAAVLSFVWFLYRLKTNFFVRALANEVLSSIDRDRLLKFENVSSIGLLVIGVMSLAEACGVAVQSVLTVGGIGGVATAFAARDILGNLLSGISLQFSNSFSVGDNIKAGSVEGLVVEMGLTTTTLIDSEKFPVIVPNSLFSCQMIVNKSRAQCHALLFKIPLQIDDVDKIPQISEEIMLMLHSHPKIFLEMDVPYYCYLSRIETSRGELSIGCGLKKMKRKELYAAEQDILLQATKIMMQHGAILLIHQPLSFHQP